MNALKRQNGFALLITITLLAFLVLLLVSLASLTRVETQVASNGRKLAGARANALLALNLAVGQLQKFAGPDQVLSARADITSAGALPQPYLTGLWKTTNTTSVPDTWLVSGNETSPVAKTPSNVPDPATGAEPAVDGASGYVFLVGSSSAATPGQRIRLEKQPVIAAAGTVPGLSAAATVGHYAWWIGDEGVKASASLINPLVAANPIAYDNAAGSAGQGDHWSAEPLKRARLDQFQLTRPRLEHVFPAFNPDTDGLAALPKLRNNSQLLLAPNAPAPNELKAQFHNLTPLSRAVLADVTAGRLKKDLSDTSAPPDPAILAFQQTRVTLAGAPAGVYDSYYSPVAASVPAATAYPAYSLGPVLTEVGVRLQFYINSTDSRVHYAYVIDAELWNPYTAHLRLAASAPLTLEISGLPTFTVRTDGVTPNTTLTLPTLTASFDHALTADPANPWREGRLRVFRGTGSLPQVTPPTTPPATITIFDAVLPGAPVDPTATTVTLTYAASTSFTAVLKVNGDVLATYAPHLLAGPPLQYNAGGTTNSGGPAPGPAGFIVGYGYEFADDMSAFTGETPGTGFIAVDPRLPSLRSAFYNNGSAPWNAGNPRNNTSGIGTANTFSTGGNGYAHYDLPRQEITSLAMLTHVIGAKSYAAGNTWGGAANTVFDQYHVSTVPRYATTWTPENGLPLPNRYLEIYHPENTPAIPLADLRSSANSSRYFLQKGAFNINSTSIDAWRAVLGSKFSAWRYAGNTAAGIALDNVFFRLPHGAQQIFRPPLVTGGVGVTARTQSPSQTGGRQLTAQEVTDLATQIVAQIRAHARPYVSLAEFVNDGVIAKAIAAVPSINAVVPGAFTNTRRYTPGALLQSDVIGALAPFMSARSDTFVVRAYGDSQNPVNDAVEGRAWCEAVVQRLPDLAADAPAPLADIVPPAAASHPFGRKFKIISFRWLTPSDL